jgi:hypothetical protein
MPELCRATPSATASGLRRATELGGDTFAVLANGVVMC